MTAYGSLMLTETSPVQSFTEPITLAEMKEYLNLPERSPTDAGEDDLINGMITAAREMVEIEYGRDLVRKQYDMVSDYWPSWFEVRDPLVSVDLVRYRSSDGSYTTLVDGTDYVVSNSRHLIIPAFGTTWPSFTAWPSSAVLVRFTSGYAATDAFWNDSGKRLLIRMKLLVSAWYNNRLPIDAGRKLEDWSAPLGSFGARRNVR